MSISAAITLEEGMAHLAAVVGPEHAEVREGVIAASAADPQQIAQILRFARANGLVLMPTGGGTKLGWGNPVVPEIALSLQRMNVLRDHAWQDMTCTVEAGCSWAAMQTELRRHGQMVALDPLWPDRATVGGVIASNDSGPLRLKFGGLRDLIIGMTIVLADGTIAKSGGKVVKNVAGYDLHKLITGSFGTLGVIAEVTFRLHPVEQNVRTWSVMAPGTATPGFFTEPLRALMDKPMTPSCVQLRASKDECSLDIRIAGSPECLEEYSHRIQNLCAEGALSEAGEDVWQARQRLFDGGAAIVIKVSLLPSEVCLVSSELKKWATTEGHEIDVVAQARGLMTVALKSAPDEAIGFIERLRKRVAPSGGSAIVLQTPGSLRGKVNVWGPDPNALDLMREIKQRFDPERILNPGRFVGGI
jgi:glycolate oxidase FAD binding subunit